MTLFPARLDSSAIIRSVYTHANVRKVDMTQGSVTVRRVRDALLCQGP